MWRPRIANEHLALPPSWEVSAEARSQRPKATAWRCRWCRVEPATPHGMRLYRCASLKHGQELCPPDAVAHVEKNLCTGPQRLHSYPMCLHRGLCRGTKSPPRSVRPASRATAARCGASAPSLPRTGRLPRPRCGSACGHPFRHVIRAFYNRLALAGRDNEVPPSSLHAQAGGHPGRRGVVVASPRWPRGRRGGTSEATTAP